jgi:hypothetical protein
VNTIDAVPLHKRCQGLPLYSFGQAYLSCHETNPDTIRLKPCNILSFRHVATGFLILSVALAGSTATRASDLAREQRLAEQIVGAILDGESAQLQVPGAAHYFGGYEDKLVDVVANWLDRLVMPVGADLIRD